LRNSGEEIARNMPEDKGGLVGRQPVVFMLRSQKQIKSEQNREASFGRLDRLVCHETVDMKFFPSL
jgi:hypothetical protein